MTISPASIVNTKSEVSVPFGSGAHVQTGLASASSSTTGLAGAFAQLLATLLGNTGGADARTSPPTGEMVRPSANASSAVASFPSALNILPMEIGAVDDIVEGLSVDATLEDFASAHTAEADLPNLLAELLKGVDSLSRLIAAGEKPDAAQIEDLGSLLDDLALALGLDPARIVPITAEAFEALDLPDMPSRPLLTGFIDAIDVRAPTPLAEAGTPELAEFAGKLRAVIAALSDGTVDANDLPSPEHLAQALRSLRRQDGAEALTSARSALGLPVEAEVRPVSTPERSADTRLTGVVASQAMEAPADDAESGMAARLFEPQSEGSPVRLHEARPVKTVMAAQASSASATTISTSLDAALSGSAASPTVSVDAASAARAQTVPGYQTSQQQLNLPQLAFEVVRQVHQGNTQFQIRLDPPELGRIDVRMDIDAAGNVNARLTVEKTETLDLMQRDQRALERALAQAGLDMNKTNLEFSMRQNPFARDGGDRDARPGSNIADADEAAAPVAENQPVTLYRGAISARGLNLIV